MAVIPEKMQAPRGVKSANIMGHEYDSFSKEGHIKVAIQAHVEELRKHGFIDVIEQPKTADEITDMRVEELTEFLEERGIDVPTNVKPKALKILALNAAGFDKEAKALAK